MGGLARERKFSENDFALLEFIYRNNGVSMGDVVKERLDHDIGCEARVMDLLTAGYIVSPLNEVKITVTSRGKIAVADWEGKNA